MRYPLILLGVLGLASCAPTTTSPIETQIQPKAPPTPAKPAVDYSTLAYDAPEWDIGFRTPCFIGNLSMNYRNQTLSLRDRLKLFDYEKTSKSSSLVIHKGLVDFYREIDTNMNNDYKRMKGDWILTSSYCVQEINYTLQIINSAILDRDPIERQYKASINKANTLYKYESETLEYMGFYGKLLDSIARELDKAASVINSKTD